MISGLKTGMIPKFGGAGKAASAKPEKASQVSGFAVGDTANGSKDGDFAEHLGAIDRAAIDRPMRTTRDHRREDEQKVGASNAQPASQAAHQSAVPSAPQAVPQAPAGPETEESGAVENMSPSSPNRMAPRALESAPDLVQAAETPEIETQTTGEAAEAIPDVSKPLVRPEASSPLVVDGLPPSGERLSAVARPQAADEAAASGDVVLQAQQAQAQVRRQAMQNFMSRMQNEFGVPPEKIVDAFSRMDEASLMKPPEESANEFLGNLEIPHARQAKAAELYNQMLDTTGEAALNEKIIGREAGLQMRVLSPREEALRKLNESIDQLNDAFAMRNTKVMVSPSAPMDSTMKAQLAAEQMNAELLKMERMSQTGEAGRQPEDNSDDGVSAIGASTQSEESSVRGFPTLMGAGALAAGAGGFESMNSGAGDASSRPELPVRGGPAPAAENVSSVATRFKMPTIGESAKAGARKSLSDAGELASSGASAAAPADANALSGAANVLPGAEKATASGGPAAMLINRPTPTAQDEKDNVKELIRQAQLAVKKGGGEIKMDLKPEGMGQIKLKVSVENGQVNVQMLTESDAAKRLLEKGLHELKSNLAAQHLKVDTMKVDVGQELQKHMDNGADQGREQTRQFANDVMSQMRDQRQAFQQGFMENRGWRQYPRENSSAETGIERASRAAETSASGTNGRARRADAGRLDLVA